MRPLIVHREAKAELDHAMAYYEKQCVGLGLDLHTKVEEACREIQKTPMRCAIYKDTEL